ncbi:glutathione S-transferase U10-like [Panicum miliaceum]|uniref:Glutathione S-transferase n=1 Tax=Panicum miliaceum TaxID=4540 RepID=A0A3L6RXS2_PANMI|nr:glutathione S-transferase U10-like [Panicum miliaceum]
MEPREVKLYGAWGSAHATMARNALALKGVRYEYVEEDLDNKSEALLRLNPVHGKVPVLVVDGRPLAESLVILEYADEAWPEGRGHPPALLPREPRARAAARFWARFFHDEVSPLSRAVVLADAAAERAELAREVKARVAVMEAGIAGDFPRGGEEGEGPFVHGRSPGLLDVVLGSCAAGTRVLSAVSGVEIVEPGATPRVHASVAAFDELAAGFGTTVPHELLLARLLESKARSRAAAA